MKRIITWVKPTWNWLHIWNYFWAIKPFIQLASWNEALLFIADYHSLTSVHDKTKLKEYTQNILIEYMSLIDDENIIIFKQSNIQKINDISWILSSVTPYSLMLRSHAFKDSQNKNSSINMATFNYPILMSADIISYDADIVPIWKDQIQHLEFARDIALSFNSTYNEDIFKLPSYHIDKNTNVILWIDWRKMSKSYWNFIPIFADEKEIKKIIMSIKTDDKTLEEPKDPEECIVFSLIKLFANDDKIKEISQKYKKWNYWYWHAKIELFEIMMNYFKKAREKYKILKENPDLIQKKIDYWNKFANDIVDLKYKKIKNTIWL